MRSDIRAGATFPDYELPDHTGAVRRLSHLLGDGAGIVVLARGIRCGKDVMQQRLLVRFHEELEVGYTKLVTISTDTVTESKFFRTAVAAPWAFLSDTERVVQRDLDIKQYNARPGDDPMIPHTFVLAPGLVVAKVYMGYWYWGRPRLDELRRDLAEIFARRPDWDITAPGMLEAWEAGDRSGFFQYEPVPAWLPPGSRAG